MPSTCFKCMGRGGDCQCPSWCGSVNCKWPRPRSENRYARKPGRPRKPKKPPRK